MKNSNWTCRPPGDRSHCSAALFAAFRTVTRVDWVTRFHQVSINTRTWILCDPTTSDDLAEWHFFWKQSGTNLFFLWPPSRAGHYILLLWFLSSFFLFFSLPVLSGRRLDVYHAYTHDVALVQIWNACLKCAVRGSVTIQDVKIRHLCTITQLCQAISSQLRHALTIRKELVKQQCLLPMSSNIVNFGPLVAEICFRVWGTPANFNGFCILALLFH